MSQTGLQNIEKLETTLWAAADNLRANSHKSSSEYCMPVLGVIFLRHATNRYDAACREIAADLPKRHLPARVNQHVMIIRPDPSFADPYFVLASINSDGRKRQLLSYARAGGTREALTKDVVDNFHIIMPDTKLWKRFGEIAGEMFQQIDVLASQNAALRKARDLLLPRLMSGELAV